LEDFVKAVSKQKLSDEEKAFLKNPYIVDLIKDFIFKLDIKYDKPSGVILKGR
jgi:hypothetical protein